MWLCVLAKPATNCALKCLYRPRASKPSYDGPAAWHIRSSQVFFKTSQNILPLPNSPRKWRRTVFWAIPKILATFLLLKVLLSSLILRGLARAFGLRVPVNALLRRRRAYFETTCPRPLAQLRPPSFSELLNFLINAVLRALARLAETISRTSSLHCERGVFCMVRQSTDKERFLFIQYDAKASLTACSADEQRARRTQ